MLDEATVQKAVQALLEAVPAGSKVILFGSYGRGNPVPESDLDFLVIEPLVKDSLAEMARLRKSLDRVIKSYLITADVLVISQKKFDRLSQVQSTVYYQAAKEGRQYECVA